MNKDRGRFYGTFLSMVKSRFITQRPFFLAHAVTYGCNSQCKTCTYWHMTNRMKEDLSTVEVFELLDEAYKAGMRGYYIFGGEPLVRSDIEEIVEYAKNRGYLTTMNTNASHLYQCAESLGETLDFAFVSLDYHNERHDLIRGRSGSFDEVMKGVKRLKETGNTKVTLVTTISKLNFDTIEPMAKLAKSLNVGITYNAVEPMVKSSYEEGMSQEPVLDHGLSPGQQHVFYETLLSLKMQGYTLMETSHVLRDYAKCKPWVCHFPKIFTYVSPDKKIFDCLVSHTYDLKEGSFKEYLGSDLFRNYVKAAEQCNSCVRTCVRMYSYAYEFRLLNILDLRRDLRILKNQTNQDPFDEKETKLKK